MQHFCHIHSKKNEVSSLSASHFFLFNEMIKDPFLAWNGWLTHKKKKVYVFFFQAWPPLAHRQKYMQSHFPSQSCFRWNASLFLPYIRALLSKTKTMEVISGPTLYQKLPCFEWKSASLLNMYRVGRSVQEDDKKKKKITAVPSNWNWTDTPVVYAESLSIFRPQISERRSRRYTGVDHLHTRAAYPRVT